MFISAASGDGVDALVAAVTQHLPVSPYLYPDDDISTQPVRFFCAEFVRGRHSSNSAMNCPTRWPVKSKSSAKVRLRCTFVQCFTLNGTARSEL